MKKQESLPVLDQLAILKAQHQPHGWHKRHPIGTLEEETQIALAWTRKEISSAQLATLRGRKGTSAVIANSNYWVAGVLRRAVTEGLIEIKEKPRESKRVP